VTREPRAGDPAADPGQRRRAFRAFVRTHHPDVGGDPALFAAGLQAWRRHPKPAPSGVVFYRRRRGVAVLIGWWRDRRRRAGRRRVL